MADDVVIPVVGECDDSFLNDCRRMQVEHEDVVAAHAAALASRGGAGARPPEGAVGAGTGMSCLGFKGGIGTSSRVTPAGHTVAVLLLTNFGERKRLTVDGVPRRAPAARGPGPPAAGRFVHRRGGHRRTGDQRRLRPARAADRPRAGPHRLDRAQRQRRDLPRRLHDPARPRPRPGRRAPWSPAAGLDDLFEAVVDAAEEAVLNSLLMAPTTTGRDGNVSEGLDPETVVQLMGEHARGN